MIAAQISVKVEELISLLCFNGRLPQNPVEYEALLIFYCPRVNLIVMNE